MSLRCDPFYTRPLGIGASVGDALFAQCVSAELGVGEAEVAERVSRAYERAARNPRGLRRAVPSADAIARSGYDATPLRSGQRAPLSDGAVSLVLAAERFVQANPGASRSPAMAGVGWASDSYRLDGARLRSLAFGATRLAGRAAPGRGGSAAELDAIELDTPTGWHEAAYVRAFGIDRDEALSPGGGTFAQNPLFCAGLVNAAEAVLQVAGRAGPVQRPNVRRAAAHGCHGIAQQGNVVMVFESAGADR